MHATDFLRIEPSERAKALEAWIAEQLDTARYAEQLVVELGAMQDLPFEPHTGNGDTQLICLLEAAGIRHPLASLAEAGSPATRAVLLAYASTSALVTGDLADIPYTLAREAVLLDAGCEAAVQAFEDSLYGYTDELFDDMLDWQLERPEVAAMALAAARKVSESWSPADQQRLAEFERLIA
ncbi:MAG: hypothetical protein IPK80_03170 [Nannocystis sp.]|nr:hypothetical protein [Nannocystis sp.]